MVNAFRYLNFFLVLCISINYNQGDPRVYYQFNITEIPTIHNGTSKHSNETKTEEIITGWRESLFLDPNNATNSTEEIYYLEKVEFNHDENGYHVTHNVSELDFGSRFNLTDSEVITNMDTEEVITNSPQQ